MDYRLKKKRNQNKKRKNDDPYKYVARLLKYRLRSEKELRLKLSERFSDEVVNKTIDVLKEKGLIDDRRFAYMFAQDQLNIYGHGPYVIKRKLKQLGVDEEIIEEEVERAFEEFDIESFVKKVVNRYKDPRKVKDYLFKRGFDPSILDNFDF